MGAIEDAIFDKDRMRIGVYREHLPENFCELAAKGVLEHPGRAFILTGFYIPVPYEFPLPKTGSVEIDGPVGAYAIGEALRKLDYEVTYITDRYGQHCFDGVPGADDVVEFPITDLSASEQIAKDLIAEKNPSVMIAIERCGVTAKGIHRNGARGWDIGERTAKLDPLFDNHSYTVGIGDQGNELGVGNLAEWTPAILPTGEPTITRSTWPIIATVSNWGGLGLVAALSLQVGRNLLPTVEADKSYIRWIVDRGVVDGGGRWQNTPDGFTLEQNAACLERLWAVLVKAGITSS